MHGPASGIRIRLLPRTVLGRQQDRNLHARDRRAGDDAEAHRDRGSQLIAPPRCRVYRSLGTSSSAGLSFVLSTVASPVREVNRIRPMPPPPPPECVVPTWPGKPSSPDPPPPEPPGTPPVPSGACGRERSSRWRRRCRCCRRHHHRRDGELAVDEQIVGLEDYRAAGAAAATGVGCRRAAAATGVDLAIRHDRDRPVRDELDRAATTTAVRRTAVTAAAATAAAASTSSRSDRRTRGRPAPRPEAETGPSPPLPPSLP